MQIKRFSADKAVVFFKESELGADTEEVSLKNPLIRRLLKKAIRSAFGSPLPRVAAELFPTTEGSAFILRPVREGSCTLALRFPDAAAACDAVAYVASRFSPQFCISDGELTLLLSLPCGEAERLVRKVDEFAFAEFISSARAAYIREWSEKL